MKKAFILLALLGCLMATAQEIKITGELTPYDNQVYNRATAEYTTHDGKVIEFFVFISKETETIPAKQLESMITSAMWNTLENLKSPRSWVQRSVIIKQKGKGWNLDFNGYAHNSYGAEVESFNLWKFKINKKGQLITYERF